MRLSRASCRRGGDDTDGPALGWIGRGHKFADGVKNAGYLPPTTYEHKWQQNNLLTCPKSIDHYNYRWSSFHANGDGKNDALLTPHEQYLLLGRTTDTRREAYRALFKAHLDEETIDEIRAASNGNYALASERFQAQIGKALKRRVTRGKAGRPPTEAKLESRQDKLF